MMSACRGDARKTSMPNLAKSFDGTAGQAERHRPDARLAGPVDGLLDRREHEVLLEPALDPWRAGGGCGAGNRGAEAGGGGDGHGNGSRMRSKWVLCSVFREKSPAGVGIRRL